jgi:hypothetical protein
VKAQTLLEWLDDHSRQPQPDLAVYATRPPRVDRSVVDDIARHFAIQGEVQTEPDTYLIQQNKRALMVYRASGAFTFSDFNLLHERSYRPSLPSEAEAEKIAVQYLKKHHWWPEGAVLAGVHVGQFEQIGGAERQKRTLQPNHICVDFRLRIDDLNTYGAGAKIKVYLGDKGEVIGLFHAVPKIEKRLDRPAAAAPDLKATLQRKLNFPLKSIEVRDVTLAYLCESPLINTGFIHPVYVFTLAAPIKTGRGRKSGLVEFMTHPIPATGFAPAVTIDAPDGPLSVGQNEPLTLACQVSGGTAPFRYRWESSIDGVIGSEPVLKAEGLTIAHRAGRLAAHTIKVTVSDAHGYQDTHQVAVRVMPRQAAAPRAIALGEPVRPDDPDDPYVGVEWCNLYHGSAPDISGTDASAQGFRAAMQALPSWSSRFDWGNDTAWEEDFKLAGAAGGGTDSYWSDNVHFAFFAGHGSSGSFWFGSTVDDHEMRAQDARWGDGTLNWIVLHACQTMRNNFEWDVWCDAFKGLHQMFGFHTNTEGSTPPLGSRFAFWMAFRMLPWMEAMTMQQAWRQACSECFDASVEYAVIYANQAGTNTAADHLPGYGAVSADPSAPNMWSYYKGTC